MAMQFNTPASNNNGAQGTNESWKAAAFINLWVRRADGSRVKLGALPLKESKLFEKALIERLTANPDDVAALKGALEMDFQLANREPSSVNLGF